MFALNPASSLLLICLIQTSNRNWEHTNNRARPQGPQHEPPTPSACDWLQDKDSVLKQGYISPTLESDT